MIRNWGKVLASYLIPAGKGHCVGQDPQTPVSWWEPHSSPLDGFGGTNG
jgi:hypothetical protein